MIGCVRLTNGKIQLFCGNDGRWIFCTLSYHVRRLVNFLTMQCRAGEVTRLEKRKESLSWDFLWRKDVFGRKTGGYWLLFIIVHLAILMLTEKCKTWVMDFQTSEREMREILPKENQTWDVVFLDEFVMRPLRNTHVHVVDQVLWSSSFLDMKNPHHY